MRAKAKSSLKKIWSIWADLSLGAIILVVIIGLLGTVYGLRSNNLRMVELRNNVFMADQEGGDTEQALKDLRAHVLGHMNTDLSRNSAFSIEGEKPIQLVHQYYRDAIESYEVVLSGSAADLAILNDARTSCEVPSVDISQRLSCIATYVAEKGGNNFPRLDPPAKDFYVFDFPSPGWSPDIAGFSMALFGFGIFLLATRFIVGAVVSRMIARRQL